MSGELNQINKLKTDFNNMNNNDFVIKDYIELHHKNTKFGVYIHMLENEYYLNGMRFKNQMILLIMQLLLYQTK